MRNEKIKENCLSRLLYFSLLISCFLFLVSLSACGRRGDPVAVLPRDSDVVKRESISLKVKEVSGESTEVKKEETGTEEIELITPTAPAGLVALYTEKSIILTWDEIRSERIRSYNIYRSEKTADAYELVGDSTIPAFTDKNVERKTRYFYRVTAVGPLESGPSKEIDILTEVP